MVCGACENPSQPYEASTAQPSTASRHADRHRAHAPLGGRAWTKIERGARRDTPRRRHDATRAREAQLLHGHDGPPSTPGSLHRRIHAVRRGDRPRTRAPMATPWVRLAAPSTSPGLDAGVHGSIVDRITLGVLPLACAALIRSWARPHHRPREGRRLLHRATPVHIIHALPSDRRTASPPRSSRQPNACNAADPPAAHGAQSTPKEPMAIRRLRQRAVRCTVLHTSLRSLPYLPHPRFTGPGRSFAPRLATTTASQAASVVRPDDPKTSHAVTRRASTTASAGPGSHDGHHGPLEPRERTADASRHQRASLLRSPALQTAWAVEVPTVR